MTRVNKLHEWENLHKIDIFSLKIEHLQALMDQNTVVLEDERSVVADLCCRIIYDVFCFFMLQMFHLKSSSKY